MRTALATMALLASVSSTSAQMITERCTESKYGFACITTLHKDNGNGMARIIQVPQPESQEDQDAALLRETQWLATCKPLPVLDKHGVTRMTYDAACPNGVIIGTGTRPK